MSTVSRPRGAFGVKKRNVPGVLFRAQAMHDAITASASVFATPTITMVTFRTLITALSVTQQSAKGTRAAGSATLRNTRRDAVWTAMESLRTYAQGLADILDAESAASLLEMAGLLVAESTAPPQKAVLTATLTTTPGLVHLGANASLLVGKADAYKKVTFNWQCSPDGGTTWNGVHATPYASTDVPGLALMTTYSFRVSVTVAKVTGAWSDAVSLLVH